jgi:hypothetical protein
MCTHTHKHGCGFLAGAGAGAGEITHDMPHWGGWNLKGMMELDLLTKGSTSEYARLYRKTSE